MRHMLQFAAGLCTLLSSTLNAGNLVYNGDFSLQDSGWTLVEGGTFYVTGAGGNPRPAAVLNLDVDSAYVYAVARCIPMNNRKVTLSADVRVPQDSNTGVQLYTFDNDKCDGDYSTTLGGLTAFTKFADNEWHNVSITGDLYPRTQGVSVRIILELSSGPATAQFDNVSLTEAVVPVRLQSFRVD
jgi:hypothetical protein